MNVDIGIEQGARKDIAEGLSSLLADTSARREGGAGRGRRDRRSRDRAHHDPREDRLDAAKQPGVTGPPPLSSGGTT
jgi:hypothetical protein